MVQANTTRLDDAGDKKPEAWSRTEDCLRTGDLKPANRVNMIVMDDPSGAKTPEVQNTVMDERRANPQRVKRAFPTAGQATES